MEIAFQVVSIILIIGAVLLFWKKNSGNPVITNFQKALVVFQIVLCGGFFALCVSDVLDIRVNFSAVRVSLNVFYALVFLSLTAFALSFLSCTCVSEYFLRAGVPFPDGVRPVGPGTEKAKAYPADCLLKRRIDRGAVLCFSV